MKKMMLVVLAWHVLFLLLPGPLAETVLRVGYLPNLTHAQALVGMNLVENNRDWFERKLGEDVRVEWFSYNSGTGAMEAMLAGSIDLSYVGPSPALNAYMRTLGRQARIISGAANGGAALVVQGDQSIQTPADFRNKKVATPQLGNTQDVACRSWLKQQGLVVRQTGGDVLVFPTRNPDQLALFKNRLVDAVWTAEPWVSRLELEAKGKIFLEQSNAITTVLVSTDSLLNEKDEWVKKFVQVHSEMTDWIRNHPDEAKTAVKNQLEKLIHRPFPAELLERAWGRIDFTTHVSRDEMDRFIADAAKLGFLRGEMNTEKFILDWVPQ